MKSQRIWKAYKVENIRHIEMEVRKKHDIRVIQKWAVSCNNNALQRREVRNKIKDRNSRTADLKHF